MNELFVAIGVAVLGYAAYAGGLFGDDAGGGGKGEAQYRFAERPGGILGSGAGFGAGPTIWNLPAQPSVSFPAAPTFDFGRFFPPPPPSPPPSVQPQPQTITRPAARRAGGGYESAPVVSGYVPMKVSGGTYTYSKKETAISEAVSAGLPQEVAERELSIYNIPRGGMRISGTARASSGVSSVKKSTSVARKNVATPVATAKAKSRRESLVARARAASGR